MIQFRIVVPFDKPGLGKLIGLVGIVKVNPVVGRLNAGVSTATATNWVCVCVDAGVNVVPLLWGDAAAGTGRAKGSVDVQGAKNQATNPVSHRDVVAVQIDRTSKIF